MKKLLTLAILGIISLQSWAQSPNSINYQAVIRNSSGTLIQSSNVGLRLSVLKGSSTGSTVYTETHNASTNKYGVVNLQIGNGSTTDNFSSIAWGTDGYYLKIELDENGGSSYKTMGTTQFVSVPFALYANKAKEVENDGDSDDKNEIQTLSQNGNQISLSNNGGSVTINTDDADADDSNELQKLSVSGNKVSLDQNGGSVTVDVDDADADVTNELQKISISGSVITLDQNGGSVTLPSGGAKAVWTESGDTAFYTDHVKIGDGTVAKGARAVIGATTKGNNTGLEAWAANGTTNYAVTAVVEASTTNADNSAAISAILDTDSGTGNAVYAEASGTSGAIALRSFAETDAANVAGQFTTTSGSSNSNGQTGLEVSVDGSGTGNHIGIDAEGYGNGVYNVGGAFWANNTGKTNGDVARAGQFVVQDTSDALFNQGMLVIGAGGGSGTTTVTHGVYATASGNTVQNTGVSGNTAGTGTNNIGLEGVANGSSSSSTNYGLYAQGANGGTNYAGYFSGNVTYTGSLVGPSDAKLKNDITPLNKEFSALNRIDALEPVVYTYKTDEFPSLNLPNGEQYGFVAQEMQEVFPLLVEKQRSPDRIIGGDTPANDDTEVTAEKIEGVEYNGINYMGMIPVLTQGIKEQQEQINTLQEEVEALKKQNELLLELLKDKD